VPSEVLPGRSGRRELRPSRPGINLTAGSQCLPETVKPPSPAVIGQLIQYSLQFPTGPRGTSPKMPTIISSFRKYGSLKLGLTFKCGAIFLASRRATPTF